MKTRTLLAVAVTGALITGATAGGVIFHQHAQGVAAFDEARDKLAAKIETIETARGTAVADLAEAQHILDLASQPGALARTPALTDLDAAVSRATERMSAYDELLAGPQTALAEADSERDSLFWRSDFAEATAAMLSQVNLGSAAGVPELQLEAVAAAVEELERTTEIVATEKRITGTPAAQDSSGSYRPAVEKLISDAGFHVRRTTTEAAACGDQPIRGAAAEAEIAKRGKRTNHVGATFVVRPPNGQGTVTLIRRPSGWALCDYSAEYDSRAPIPGLHPAPRFEHPTRAEVPAPGFFEQLFAT